MKTTTRTRRATRARKAPTKATRTRRKVAEKGGRSPTADNVASSDQSTIEVAEPAMEVDNPFRRITRAAARAAKQATSSEPIKEELPRVDKGKGKAKDSAEAKLEATGTKRKRRGQDAIDDNAQNEQDVTQTRPKRRTRRRVESTTEAEALSTGGEPLVPSPQPLVQEAAVEEMSQMVVESTIKDAPQPGPTPSSSRVTLDQTEHQPTLRRQDTLNMDTNFAHTAGPAPPQEALQPASSLNNPPATQVDVRPAHEARPPGINRDRIVMQRPIRPLPVRVPREQVLLERARRILRRFDLLKHAPSLLVNFDFGW